MNNLIEYNLYNEINEFFSINYIVEFLKYKLNNIFKKDEKEIDDLTSKFNKEVGDLSKKDKIISFYKKHENKFFYLWKKIAPILPPTIGSKLGVKLILSDDPEKTLQGSAILSIILLNDFKKKYKIEGKSEKELLNNFREYLKNKGAK